jgi:glycerol-3-phosphate dehydrogenase subunit B
MNTYNKETTCDLMIIGTGMAGMAAALFAARQGIDTVQVGLIGEIGFASGLIDLLGVHPVAQGKVLDDPWQGITRLCRDEPLHPYALLDIASIRESLDIVLAFLLKSGYPHFTLPQRNMEILTPAGTLKPTYAVPHTMCRGPSALADRSSCLLVDFDGLKGYSARQIALSLADRWPELHPVRIGFPDAKGELYTEHMARTLDIANSREKLVAAIRPHIGTAEVVGLPAVLGMYRTVRVMEDLQQGLGVPVFEIPTMLPAVTGLRLREIFEQRLPAMGIRPFFQQRVMGAQRLADGRWRFDVGRADIDFRITARSAIMCSGRFFGKGLHADRHGIRETIFDLPVVQPKDRAAWHHKDLLHREGHPINRAGVAVDGQFNPMDANGQKLYPSLFVAGSILAHQDWKRQKCGSGFAIATAYGAVQACARMLA